MSWARLDDAILDNPKIIAAGPLGFALHVAAITWCARNLSDGQIPKRRVAQLLDLPSLQVSETTKVRVLHALTPDDVATDLVRIGLWHDRGECWEVHDYLVYNPSAAEVRAVRAARAEAGRRGGCSKSLANAKQTASKALANVCPVPVPGSGSGEDLLSFASLTQGAEAPRLTELGFDRFWATYPKKRHKPAASRAWKAVDGARHLEPIVAGVERWKATETWRQGFIEDPSTFLRQRQWEDAVPEDAAAAQRAKIEARLAEAHRQLEEGTL
jgi:hypothetical protein